MESETLAQLQQDILEDHEINKITLSSDMKKIFSFHPNKYKNSQTKYTISTPSLTEPIIKSAFVKNIDVQVQPEPVSFLDQFGTFLITCCIVSIISSLFVSSRNPMTPMPPFLPRPFTTSDITTKKSNTTLKDWGGSPELLEECAEVVSYLKNDTLYKLAGAEIPRGILLEGPPGTGKTLIAKAIAGECKANFISVVASEFVEVFVGLGAQKVRHLFETARKNKPCIIFLDEIDSIGKKRGSGFIMSGSDEREQTLNQLLAELDGFQSNDGILVIAATNRKDVLDSALLRPGRFDRVLTIPLPDKQSREDILTVHLRNKKTEINIPISLLAEMTNGFSGAQLKNLVNEAAIYAAREGEILLTYEYLERALEKVVVGIVKKIDTRNEQTRKRIAIHEIGHAYLTMVYDAFFDLKKVTIQATYSGAGGFTLFSEREELVESGLYTKDLLKKRLIISMGGKAAETLFYGEEFVSLGAIQDLKTANALAQTMVGNYGMGRELKVFYKEEMNTFSDQTREKLDKESLALVQEAYQEAFNILSRHKDEVQTLYRLLLERQSLTKDMVKAFFVHESLDEFYP